MKIKFWGTRGSIPSPGTEGFATQKYGGNTPCIEVRTEDNTIIVIDAGTGIRLLGNELMGLDSEGKKVKETPFSIGKGELHILISHLHWDHIQGLPFFKPLYIKGNKIRFFSLKNCEEKLKSQMKAPFFPIDFDTTQATKIYSEIKEGDKIKIGSSVIDVKELSHPDNVFSFRIQDNNSIITYASDVENDIANRNSLLELAGNADVLVYDCQYTFMEYDPQYHGKNEAGKKDWGHSIIQEGVRIAAEAGVKKLISFHHSPESSDKKIDDILNFAQKFKKDYNGKLEIMAAYEGLELEIK